MVLNLIGYGNADWLTHVLLQLVNANRQEHKIVGIFIGNLCYLLNIVSVVNRKM